MEMCREIKFRTLGPSLVVVRSGRYLTRFRSISQLGGRSKPLTRLGQGPVHIESTTIHWYLTLTITWLRTRQVCFQEKWQCASPSLKFPHHRWSSISSCEMVMFVVGFSLAKRYCDDPCPLLREVWSTLGTFYWTIGSWFLSEVDEVLVRSRFRTPSLDEQQIGAPARVHLSFSLFPAKSTCNDWWDLHLCKSNAHSRVWGGLMNVRGVWGSR